MREGDFLHVNINDEDIVNIDVRNKRVFVSKGPPSFEAGSSAYLSVQGPGRQLTKMRRM